MSLRRRLALMIVLGLATAFVAISALLHVYAASNRAREHAAATSAEGGALALAEDLVDPRPNGDAPSPRAVTPADVTEHPTPAARMALTRLAVAVVRPLANAAGGYCTDRGEIVAGAAKHTGPTEERRDATGVHAFPLAANVEPAVKAACAKAAGGALVEDRAAQEHAVDRVAVAPAGPHVAAWLVVRAPVHESSRAAFEMVTLAVLATLLALLALDAIFHLRRGVGALDRGLVLLEGDLGAALPEIRGAKELALIRAGLGRLASRLADARAKERALERRLSDSERLAALGRVVAGVAHEVRSPLAGMKVHLDLLARSGTLDEEGHGDVRWCDHELARLARLVDTLLDGSRGSREATRVDLAVLADERIAHAAETARAAGVTVVRDGEGAAIGDRGVAAGALDNLLRNAIEASPMGGTVRVRVLGDEAAIEVEDEGAGVPEARVGELFEPFFTTKGGGTGLGLWMARMQLAAGGGALAYARAGGRTRMRMRVGSAAASEGVGPALSSDGARVGLPR